MFCGVGGFRLGLERAGDIGGLLQGKEQEDNGDIETKRHRFAWQSRIRFNCVWANDNDKYACQVYRKRFGNKELVEGDIQDIGPEDIPEHDFLTAGFPCQAFSVAGKRKGFQDKTRGTLFYEICRVVRSKRPKYLLLENVKGLLSHNSGRTFAIILLSLDELGYDVEWQVLNTKYWLPQNRERVFIFGIRREGG
ncbi:MAG TPA: DNA (cytosine-5-)-methyltransferase [Candidatus Aminicenantes bacterium]|nr:DNA (cytosine-5-)-methyltransferase [Candidatus Aminicenantes bacterium]